MPEVMKIKSISEPWIKATIICPDEYLGSIISLVKIREECKQNYLILDQG